MIPDNALLAGKANCLVGHQLSSGQHLKNVERPCQDWQTASKVHQPNGSPAGHTQHPGHCPYIGMNAVLMHFWQAHARSQGRWSLAVPTEAYTTKQTCPRDIPPASQSGRACTCRLTLCPQRVSASAPIPAGLHQVCHAPLPPVVRDKLLY